MIITVTMNPAIDKTVELEQFIYGGLNRIEKVTLDAGGKGINVSKTIHNLGGESIATGFLGGNNGKIMLAMIEEQGLRTDFVEIAGETRVNTKVAEAGGTVTELNEAGPTVDEEKQSELINRLLQYANEDTWFVLSGSVSTGISKTIYRDIIEKVHEKGAKVFLDADGALFSYALEAKPDVIKPNRAELEKHVDSCEKLSDDELLSVGERFLEQGIATVIISLGEEGAFFLSKEKKLRCPAVAVEAHSTVGAGDAMVAAFLYGISMKHTFEECAKLAIAASAGAVATKGTKPPNYDSVKKLQKEVLIKEI